MNKLDLKFGDPKFLQELNVLGYDVTVDSSNASYDLTKGTEAVIEQIYKLHEKVGNVRNPRSYKVVLGNGASQLLTALSRSVKVGVYRPFWSRFDYLVEDMQVFTNEYPHSDKTHKLLVTYPNNPNGALSSKVHEAYAVDASYHWPTYYNNEDTMIQLSNNILLFSFSKLSGLSSVRFGWALVKDLTDFYNMQNHVEHATCGVSVASQGIFTDWCWYNFDTGLELLDMAAVELQRRHAALQEFYPTHLYGEQRGMFFYVKDPGQVFERLGIEGYRGKIFGHSDDYIRLNIGCSEEAFKELISRLEGNAIATGHLG